MEKRPLSVTIISCLFIAAGVVGFGYHVRELNWAHPFQGELLWILLVRLLAIVGGVFLLRVRTWARWLLVLWLAYHVVLSAFHPLSELAMHSLLLAAIAWFLFRPRAAAYFRVMKSAPAQTSPNKEG